MFLKQKAPTARWGLFVVRKIPPDGDRQIVTTSSKSPSWIEGIELMRRSISFLTLTFLIGLAALSAVRATFT